MKKSPALTEEIKDYDEPILKNLTHIEETVFEDKDDSVVEFFFAPNDYFENEKLVVTMIMNEEGACSELKCEEIKWKEGKDVTKKTTTKKQKNKKTGQQRTITKTEPRKSFFGLFKNMKEEDEEDMDENEDEEALTFDLAAELFELIKDSVIPYAGAAYFGVTVPELEQDMEEDDEEYEDEDEEDDDEEEEADDKKAKKGKKGGKKDGDKKEGEKPECKQN